jgi:hypothetical protein
MTQKYRGSEVETPNYHISAFKGYKEPYTKKGLIFGLDTWIPFK